MVITGVPKGIVFLKNVLSVMRTVVNFVTISTQHIESDHDLEQIFLHCDSFFKNRQEHYLGMLSSVAAGGSKFWWLQ